MKIRAIGAQLLRAGGRTDGQRDMSWLIVVLANLRTRLKTH
jgi:hypothetical protein